MLENYIRTKIKMDSRDQYVRLYIGEGSTFRVKNLFTNKKKLFLTLFDSAAVDFSGTRQLQYKQI